MIHNELIEDDFYTYNPSEGNILSDDISLCSEEIIHKEKEEVVLHYGIDGREIELIKGLTHIQYRYIGTTDWINLISISEIKGIDAKDVEFRVDGVNLQYRYVGDVEWIQLFDLSGQGITSETPETIKEKYESNQSVIDRLARLANTSGVNTGDQDLSGYLLIEDLPTALPASDVYPWAKESTKPTYTASEVGAEPVKGADQFYVTAAEKELMLTEQTKFVLSALDAPIIVGQKAQDTVKVKHQISEADISCDLTVAPLTFDIILDIKKNGTSIFSTKPKIVAGQLVLDGNHTLITSPTVFNVGDIKTIHIDQVGLGETGQNLNLYILTHKII